jgi:hypothetical protein
MRHTVNGCLTRQLLEHLCGTGEPVTRFTNGDVEDELCNLELPHGVLLLLGGVGLILLYQPGVSPMLAGDQKRIPLRR